MNILFNSFGSIGNVGPNSYQKRLTIKFVEFYTHKTCGNFLNM